MVIYSSLEVNGYFNDHKKLITYKHIINPVNLLEILEAGNNEKEVTNPKNEKKNIDTTGNNVETLLVSVKSSL